MLLQKYLKKFSDVIEKHKKRVQPFWVVLCQCRMFLVGDNFIFIFVCVCSSHMSIFLNMSSIFSRSPKLFVFVIIPFPLSYWKFHKNFFFVLGNIYYAQSLWYDLGACLSFFFTIIHTYITCCNTLVNLFLVKRKHRIHLF